MTDLEDAIDLLSIAMPVNSQPGCGGLWFGRNRNFPDANFEDWGLARAVAIILNAVHDGRLTPPTPKHPQEQA